MISGTLLALLNTYKSLGVIMKKITTIILAMFILLAGTSLFANGQSDVDVGISMPTKSSERWIADGSNMVLEFEKLGYTPDLQYAEDVIENQVAQLENMITKGVKVLVIAPIDGESLTGILKKANEQGIKVISYDRLIKNSPYVSYYATFDNFKVGVQQASYIEYALDLKNSNKKFNVELFAGSPDDTNAYYFFDGAMSVLQPYIDAGKVTIKSGQTEMEQVATLRWDGALAQTRMDNLLSAHYTQTRLDAVLSPYDGISIGILSSLKGVGYGSADMPMPVVTGQDAEVASVKSIIAGEQTSTIFKDTRMLAKKAVQMADAVLGGKKVEVNNTTTYDNGVFVVPSYLLEPLSVDISNWESILIGSGYYTKDQILQ
jgi:putative multiple sugar transport system substrate-binding protein